MDDSLIKTIKAILNKESYCSIATSNGNNIHNSLVAFYSENYDIYFGAFTDSLKCRNIKENPTVAIVIGSLQYHGIIEEVSYGSIVYREFLEKYNKKFPQYAFYFKYEKNEMFKIVPLVIWLYDSSKGIMHRDKLIFDDEYYTKLKPFEIPNSFKIRNAKIYL